MAVTGTPFDCTGATVKIATVDVAGGANTNVTMKEMKEERTGMYFGNYPEESVTLIKTWVEGTLEYDHPKSVDIPHASSTPVALEIVATGVKLTAQVRISDPEVTLGTGDTCKVKLAYKSRPNFGATTNYTLNNNPA